MSVQEFFTDLEAQMGTLRQRISNHRVFLQITSFVALVGCVVPLVILVLPFVEKSSLWVNNLFCLAHLVTGFYLGCLTYLACANIPRANSIGAVPSNRPNLSCMKKAMGKVIALAMFTILDATLKDSNGFLVVLFCFSFFLSFGSHYGLF